MVCIYCDGKTSVINSRLQKRSNQIWRRRQCLNCKTVITTHEAADLSSALLVKSKSTLTPFLPDKLLSELVVALKAHKDTYLAAREVTDTVIQRLLRLENSPIFTPEQISDSTAGVLERLDRQAWLRYVAEHPSLQ